MNQPIGPDQPVDAAALWGTFADQMRAFLRRRVDAPDVAEDLLQELFLRAHRKIDTLENPDRAGAWMTRIARNLVIDHYRRDRPVAELPIALADEGPRADDPELEEQQVQRSLAQWIAARVEALPPHERAAVQAADLEGRRQADLARELGVSPSTLKSRVQRGRAKLRDELDACCQLELGPTGRVLEATPRGGGCAPSACCPED